MKLQRVLILCLLVLCTINVKAQIGDAIREIFQAASDSVVMSDSAHVEAETVNNDSLLVAQLQRSLDEAKLNEVNLRMEFEQYKLNILASDSIKRYRHMPSHNLNFSNYSLLLPLHQPHVRGLRCHSQACRRFR